jgi:hypothetical protein
MKEYKFIVRLLADKNNPPYAHYEVELDLPDRPYATCEMGNCIDGLAEVVKHTFGQPDKTFVFYRKHEDYRDKTVVGQFTARVYSGDNAEQLVNQDRRITQLEQELVALEKEVRLLQQ